MSAVADKAWIDRLRLAWSPSRLVDFFKERLSNGQGVSGVEIASMNYRRRRCTMRYSLACDNRPDVSLIATFGSEKKMLPVLSMAAPEPPPADPLAPGSTYLLPDIDWLIEVFPADHRVHGLTASVDPPALNRALESEASVVPRIAAVRVVQHRPHQRCTLSYDFEDGSTGFAKVYRMSLQAETTWRAICWLSEHAGRVGVSVAAPIALLAERHLVIMGMVSGTSLRDVLLTSASRAQAEAAITAVAGALVKFHALDFEPERTREMRPYAQRFHRAQLPLQLLAPELATRLGSLVETVSGAAEMLAEAAQRHGTALVHDDLHAANLLLDGDQVAVVDCDDACRGDPAMDVGHLMASIDGLSADGLGFDRGDLATFFLEEYERSSGQDVRARAWLYQGMFLIRGMIRAFVHQPSLEEDREDIAAMMHVLDRAERLLTGHG